MLVLSRHRNEWIQIGNLGRICVVETRADVVRLGFDFPKDVLVLRSELITKNGPKVHRTEIED